MDIESSILKSIKEIEFVSITVKWIKIIVELLITSWTEF